MYLKLYLALRMNAFLTNLFFLTWNSTKQNQRIIMVYFLKLFYFLHAENSALTDLQYQKMSSREQSWINATTL